MRGQGGPEPHEPLCHRRLVRHQIADDQRLRRITHHGGEGGTGVPLDQIAGDLHHQRRLAVDPARDGELEVSRAVDFDNGRRSGRSRSRNRRRGAEDVLQQIWHAVAVRIVKRAVQQLPGQLGGPPLLPTRHRGAPHQEWLAGAIDQAPPWWPAPRSSRS